MNNDNNDNDNSNKNNNDNRIMTAIYIQKTSDADDIIPANFLDFPPNFRLRTRFQAILGHFRRFQAILGHFQAKFLRFQAILGHFRRFQAIFRPIFRQFSKQPSPHITHFQNVCNLPFRSGHAESGVGPGKTLPTLSTPLEQLIALLNKLNFYLFYFLNTAIFNVHRAQI